MKRVLIAGIGNILLGDDGVGPFVVRWLKSVYTFAEGVDVEDLGTPALDFIDHIAGLDALIVIDSVDNLRAPGTITLYRKHELLKNGSLIRVDTHSPAITESLLAADIFFGMPPREVLLVGVTAGSYKAGCELGAAVRDAVPVAVKAVLAELDRIGLCYREQQKAPADLWWSGAPQPQTA